jgi:hypothetical protein
VRRSCTIHAQLFSSILFHVRQGEATEKEIRLKLVDPKAKTAARIIWDTTKGESPFSLAYPKAISHDGGLKVSVSFDEQKMKGSFCQAVLHISAGEDQVDVPLSAIGKGAPETIQPLFH